MIAFNTESTQSDLLERSTLQVKIADTEGEFARIARLNHETFAEEIPQHRANARRALVDRFHEENTYFICKERDDLLGMVAARARRPFSLDAKLPDLDLHLPACENPCEIRLLSVRKNRRRGPVFGLLMRALLRHCIENGHDVGVISGRLENVRLYEKLGFVAFGPRVGSEGAWYQPMYLVISSMSPGSAIHPARAARRARSRSGTLNVLPGPVAIAENVRAALGGEALSHRAPEYQDKLARVKARLLGFTGARGVEVLMGTGTLANDVVAGQLSLLEPGRGKGLVLANGEFGERLVKHARGFRLEHAVHRAPNEEAFDLGALEARLEADPAIGWVWAAHCETSTGRLNPIEALRDLCARRGVLLCLDCISSLGVVPVDLRGVHLATGVSGKGLGAFTGLSLVFHATAPLPAEDRLPRYLDLARYVAHDGVPYSGSSNLLSALCEALETVDRAGLIEGLRAQAEWFEGRLERAGIPFLPCSPSRSPAVFTIPLPRAISSSALGDLLQRQGIQVSYGSDYLLRDNRIQVCLMTEQDPEDLKGLVEALSRAWHELAKKKSR